MLRSTWDQIISVVSNIGWRDFIDVALVAFLIYELIALVRQTRAVTLLKGILLLFLVSYVATILQLRTLSSIMEGVIQFGMLALLIVFQPELRRALERVGRTEWFAMGLFHTRDMEEKMRQRWSGAIAAVCDAVERMSNSRTGALIVFERRSNLAEVIKTGTCLHADITPETLGTIFYEGTPLHDGAVVVRDAQIEAAGCFLPLSANLEISKDMGTRHRAALGMSENSDAVVAIVSEETGIVSLAKNGVLIRRLDRQSLYNILVDDLIPPQQEQGEKKPWFRRKKHEKDEAD
ncbi:MAG: diadenylate cyclase CdaA [Oscillospiraceae bacterium]|nr:diadenylate cyclase CdaA [Oscillospiraceae bacterium]